MLALLSFMVKGYDAMPSFMNDCFSGAVGSNRNKKILRMITLTLKQGKGLNTKQNP